MKLVVIGNYAPDRQQSMRRFTELLQTQWTERGGDVVVLAPESGRLSTRFGRTAGGETGKWWGYVDKYVLFPPHLRRRLQAASDTDPGRVVVHVADHSNAVYVPRPEPGQVPWVVTCHDLLAVRGALGEDTDCPASFLGRRLQRAITRGLERSSAIACVSTSTRDDVERLVRTHPAQLRRNIPMGLNHPYASIDRAAARSRLEPNGTIPWERPFVMHVGSNLSRKNKAGVLRVFARMADRWSGHLLFCGPELPDELRTQAAAAGVADRVFVLRHPDNLQLEAAYNLAHALLFPSRCEGFGWPIIEAQACGCPVVCSDRTSLPEVGGQAALVHKLEDEAGMAESLLRLTDDSFRAQVAARGKANLQRFATTAMMNAYAALYDEVLSRLRPR